MAEQRESSYQAAPKKRSVLVVEDERPVRELLRLHFENAGYTATTASDAIVAGKLLITDARSFDLLVVDAHMPYMTGLEFAAAIIADTTLPPLPIVLITGHEQLAARADVLDVPCLVKPFTADELIATAEKTLASKPLVSAAGLRERRMENLLRQYQGIRAQQ